MSRTATFLALTLMLLASVAASAPNGERVSDTVVQTENVRAELVAEVARVSPGASFWVALQLDIRDGWHTYWRNPGDSGEPTHLEWRLPDGVTASDIQWPYPERIPYGHLVNFGYKERALHLVRLTVPEDWPVGRPLEAVAEARWLVCDDICVPEAASFRLSLPVAKDLEEVDSASADDIAAALRRLPVRPPWPADFSAEEGHLTLGVATGADNADIASASFFPYEWGAIEPAGDQELDVRDDRLILTMVNAGAISDQLDGVLVIEERVGGVTLKRAVEISATRGGEAAGGGGSTVIAADGGGGIEGGGVSGLAKAVALAFLGGLILNLMPCVFPVLSVKAIGIVKHGRGASRELRLSGLAYTTGVLAFMAVVGGVLVALKAAGAEIGWGFQLQSPAFVSVMAIILFILGLSLSGYFAFGASVMGWGSGLSGRSGISGSFFTGALAALVATPCTAPFMGAAIGYALAQPWAVALVVMLSLGVGLAFPYLLLTWTPGVAQWLPRPGVWMERLKQLLAFPLYAAAAWLVWVLSVQAGPPAVLAALLAMILAAFAIWLLRVTREVGAKGRVAGALATALVAAAALGISFVSNGPLLAARQAATATQNDWPAHAVPFSMARLEALRARGTPVFVNITAAWCITCKLNEQVALSSDLIARDFADRGIVYLKGDWTNRDTEISRYLSAYGRGGVPLYVVYRNGHERPVVLPQILTESLVLDAVDDIPRKPAPQSIEKRS